MAAVPPLWLRVWSSSATTAGAIGVMMRILPSVPASIREIVHFSRYGLAVDHALADGSVHARILIQPDGDVLCKGSDRYFAEPSEQAAHLENVGAQLSALTLKINGIVALLEQLPPILGWTSVVAASAGVVRLAVASVYGDLRELVGLDTSSWFSLAWTLITHYADFIVSLLALILRRLLRWWVPRYLASLVSEVL